MRLIDADALIQDLSKWLKQIDPTHPQEVNAIPPMEDIIVSTLMTIEEQPTIERKKGKWTPKEERQKQEIFICSECGGWAYSPWIGSRKNPKPNRCKYNYCPNCGADMRGERE